MVARKCKIKTIFPLRESQDHYCRCTRGEDNGDILINFERPIIDGDDFERLNVGDLTLIDR